MNANADDVLSAEWFERNYQQFDQGDYTCDFNEDVPIMIACVGNKNIDNEIEDGENAEINEIMPVATKTYWSPSVLSAVAQHYILNKLTEV